MNLTLRYMHLGDIPQVVAIDQEAFTTPWSARSYAYEVTESTYSYMLVLENAQKLPLTGWKRFIHNFSSSNNNHHEIRRTILAYGGLWHIMEEAHISTIATHKTWRGQGYGELMLAAMIQRALLLEASYIVLEVRVSNTPAQTLYRKYCFEVIDTKKKYYRDNNEDAYAMRLNLNEPENVARIQQLYAEVLARHQFEDQFTTVLRPGR